MKPLAVGSSCRGCGKGKGVLVVVDGLVCVVLCVCPINLSFGSLVLNTSRLVDCWCNLDNQLHRG